MNLEASAFRSRALAAANVANPQTVLRDRRSAGRVAVRESGSFGTARRFSRRGARMRFVFLFGMLAVLGGCAMHRDVTFIYYPNAPHRETFPRPYDFYAQADKECLKYGMRASPYWSTYTSFDRVRTTYNCVQ